MAESFICNLVTGAKDRLDLPGYQLPRARDSYVQRQRECIGSWNTKLGVLATYMHFNCHGLGHLWRQPVGNRRRRKQDPAPGRRRALRIDELMQAPTSEKPR